MLFKKFVNKFYKIINNTCAFQKKQKSKIYCKEHKNIFSLMKITLNTKYKYINRNIGKYIP